MNTASSIHRQWLLLQCMGAGHWVGTVELQQKLQRDGVDVTLRTIQRDLNDLSERFPLESNGVSPQGWRWKSNAPMMSLPSMTGAQALTFMMVEQHLKDLMPASVLDELRPWFDRARTQAKEGGIHRWANKVRIVPSSQPLIPPIIKAQVLRQVQEALLTDRQLQADYSSRSRKETVHLELNPLALVQRGPVMYLVATGKSLTSGEHTDELRLYALHRFSQASVANRKAVRPPRFDLDDFLAKGRMGFGKGKLTRLKVVLTREAGEHLYESRLSKDQKIRELPDGNLEVQATVADTPQLRWWLQAMGVDLRSCGTTFARDKA